MYRIIFLGIFLSLFPQNLKAQKGDQVTKIESPTELSAGFIFAPYAATTFDDDPVFTSGTTLFLATVIAKGDWSFAPYYSFSANNVGAFVNYNISDKLGAYIVADKAIKGNNGNYILGFTTPMTADFIQGYIEIGSTYGDDPTPFLGLGIYFNIFKTLKKW